MQAFGLAAPSQLAVHQSLIYQILRVSQLPSDPSVKNIRANLTGLTEALVKNYRNSDGFACSRRT